MKNQWNPLHKPAALLLAALLLTLFSACGQHTDNPLSEKEDSPTKTEKAILDYGKLGENHYSAEHQFFSAPSVIDAAPDGKGGFYFLATKLMEDGLYFFNQETGEAELVENFTKEIERRRAYREFVHQLKGISMGEGDTLLVAARASKDYYGEPDYDPYALIRIVNLDGTLKQDIQLKGVELWSPSMAQDQEGYIYMADRGGFYSFSPEGELTSTRDVSGSSKVIQLPDGSVALIVPDYDTKLWTVKRVDGKTGGLTSLGTITDPGDPFLMITGFYPGANGYDLFYTTDLSLYGCRLSEKKEDCRYDWILSWTNCGVEGTALCALRAEEGRDFTCFSSSLSLGTESIRLRWQETDPNAEKTTLTLACRQLSTTLTQTVLKFNQQNTDCQIAVADYGAASADGVDHLTTDLNAGNAPDIFCIDGMDQNTLIRRGFLEDLWPYIDKDTQLSREDLVLPVFDALTTDGKLYALMDNFCLKTTIGLPTLVGDEPGWTLDEFWEIYENMDDCQSVAGWGAIGARKSLVDDIVGIYSQLFVDWDTGTASFDSPEFVKLLELAALLPEERIEHTDETECWLLEGRQVYAPLTLISADSYFCECYYYFANPNGTYKGYPGLPGSGCAFYLENQLAMFSGGEHKEEAWEFLRMVLLPENQSYYRRGVVTNASWMPTNLTVYNQMLEQSASDSHNPTRRVAAPGGTMPITPWTKEDAAGLWELIENTCLVEQPNTLIGGILRGEINRFFAGQQDAQTAAKAIQNRVQLCLDEQS